MADEVFDFDAGVLGVDNDEMFNVQFTSIDEVINKVVTFNGAKHDHQTVNGIRTVVAYTHPESGFDTAFVTNCRELKTTLQNPNLQFPFRAIIKVAMFSNFTVFKFFSPNTPVTPEDEERFEQYQRDKRKGRFYSR